MTRIARALLLALCAWGAAAQDALVGGLIQHSSGIPIAGANVSFLNDTTGVRRSDESKANGYFSIAGLEPGIYNITVRKPGFQTTTRMGILLAAGRATRIDFTIEISPLKETVRVEAGSTPIATDTWPVGTVVGRDFLASLPLNGRDLSALVESAPGALITPAGGARGEAGQVSVNGQRANSNRILVDGVPADSGASYSTGPDPGATGVTPALSAIGSTHSLVSLEALEEFRLETAGPGADMGRSSGGQLLLSTRSGGNRLHGALFEFQRNDRLNSNDWFANRSGLPRAALRMNQFGGTSGGPLRRNRSFFFLSYEGLRLDQPATQTEPVPSLYARMLAGPRAAVFLNSFPMPNGFQMSPAVAAYTANVPNLAGLDTAALRVDHIVNARIHLFGRYSHAPSRRSSPGLTTGSDIGLSADSVTIGADASRGAATNQLRYNFSRFGAGIAAAANLPAGAPPRDLSLFVPVPLAADSGYEVALSNLGLNWGETYALNRRQTQQYVADTLAMVRGGHQISVGGDYRRLAAAFRQNPLSAWAWYSDLNAMESGYIPDLILTRSVPVAASIQNASLSVQDSWRAGKRISLVAGLRWELGAAPTATGSAPILTLSGWPDPNRMELAPAGTPLWKTSHANLAPRLGAAWKLNQEGSLMLRAFGGVFYDTGLTLALNNLTTLPPYSAITSYDGVSVFDPPSSFSAAEGVPARVAALGYAPGFRLPHAVEWSLALERALGQRAALSLRYVGASDSALLRSRYVPTDTGQFQEVQFAEQIDNGGHSSFEALEAQLRGRLGPGLQALLSYSWAHSIDNVSKDGALLAAVPGEGPRVDRGNSDFDARQSFHSALVWSPRMFRGWTVSATMGARTGFPVDVASLVLYNGALAYASYQLTLRPDYTGAPAWIVDAGVGGGRRLNPAAFGTGAASGQRQGTLGRNAIVGFGMYQADASAARAWRVREGLALEFRAEAFNLSNHPNFANPACCESLLSAPALGQSLSMLNSALGSGSPADGLDPVFQMGGPRAVQLGLRLKF